MRLHGESQRRHQPGGGRRLDVPLSGEESPDYDGRDAGLFRQPVVAPAHASQFGGDGAADIVFVYVSHAHVQLAPIKHFPAQGVH